MENGQRALQDMINAAREEEEGGPFPASAVEAVVRGCAEALSYLHGEKKLLHGDIKSANILVLGDFQTVKLCDFGVCLDLDENLTAVINLSYSILLEFITVYLSPLDPSARLCRHRPVVRVRNL